MGRCNFTKLDSVVNKSEKVAIRLKSASAVKDGVALLGRGKNANIGFDDLEHIFLDASHLVANKLTKKLIRLRRLKLRKSRSIKLGVEKTLKNSGAILRGGIEERGCPIKGYNRRHDYFFLLWLGLRPRTNSPGS